jgi:hypothetical protein
MNTSLTITQVQSRNYMGVENSGITPEQAVDILGRILPTEIASPANSRSMTLAHWRDHEITRMRSAKPCPLPEMQIIGRIIGSMAGIAADLGIDMSDGRLESWSGRLAKGVGSENAQWNERYGVAEHCIWQMLYDATRS